MDLDLSRLNELYKNKDKEKTTENTASNLDVDTQKEVEPHNHTNKDIKALEDELKATEDTRALQVLANFKKREIENRKAQEERKRKNYLASSVLQAKIIKGILRGDNIYNLFLQAIEVIKLLTDTLVFSDQVKEDIIKIYGRGINYKKPLQIEQKEAVIRLNNLMISLDKEKDKDTKIRIKRAIEAHEELIKELQKKIEEAEDGTV